MFNLDTSNTDSSLSWIKEQPQVPRRTKKHLTIFIYFFLLMLLECKNYFENVNDQSVNSFQAMISRNIIC